MNRGLVIALVAVVVLIGAYAVYRTTAQTTTTAPVTSSSPAPTSAEVMPATTPAASTSAMMVTVNSTAFTPKTITIKVGETVTWTNSDTTAHNISSAAHPTHLVYPPLNLGMIQPGESKSLSFPTAGSYSYHDHIYPKLTGTVVVQ